jgi:hypothetical protein
MCGEIGWLLKMMFDSGMAVVVDGGSKVVGWKFVLWLRSAHLDWKKQCWLFMQLWCEQL